MLHNVVPDTAAGNHCVDSCDPSALLYNSRAYELSLDADPLNFDDQSENSFYLFRNPQMRFTVWKGSMTALRDTAFVFDEVGGFGRLSMSLLTQTNQVSPQTVAYVPPLGQLAVADGASQGFILVDLGSLVVVRPFF